MSNEINNTEKASRRGRPSGAVNRPKFQMIPLKDLTAVLQPDTLIPVGIEVAEAVRVLNGLKTPYNAVPVEAEPPTRAPKAQAEEEEFAPPVVHEWTDEDDE